MVCQCCVSGCKSIFFTVNDTKGFKPVTFFRVSKNKVRMEEWINTIPTLKTTPKVSGKTRVCIKHLDDKDIKEVIYSNVEMVIQI